MTRLNTILNMNAASCLLFGCLLLIAPAAVADYLGNVPHWALWGVGGVLILNGIHLSLAARRSVFVPLEIIWFSLGDMSWWLLTLGLIVSGHWITTSHGIIAAIVVATGVATLGIMQLWSLGIQRTGHTNVDHFAAIGMSWMALPNWVKAWLFVLNGAFLWSIFYWPTDLSKITLIAFLATGPLLMGQLAYDGGLRRILGLAHLVPWAPFLGWLLWQSHPEHSQYAQVLALILSICLVFDVYDIARFWRGDRIIIGGRKSD